MSISKRSQVRLPGYERAVGQPGDERLMFQWNGRWEFEPLAVDEDGGKPTVAQWGVMFGDGLTSSLP